MSLLDRVQLPEPDRGKRISRAGDLMAGWSEPAPDGPALAIGFGADDWPSVGLVELWIANEIGAGYCGKYMVLEPGQRCPRHHHATKHETFLALRGEIAVTLGDQELKLSPGRTLAIPTGTLHGFAAPGSEPALILELSMPCDVADNIFEAPSVRRWFNSVTT